MIFPVFQHVRLHDGGVVILKTEAVCEVSESDAKRLKEHGERFKKNMLTYHAIKGQRRIIAGILLEFEADEFSRDDVAKWCAFAGENFTLEAISAALTELHRDKKHPITQLPKKAGDKRWQVQKESLESYHR